MTKACLLVVANVFAGCEFENGAAIRALESGQDAGVWGGLSEDERRALKRRAARNRARMLESQNQF